jgi:late competence protein required for DNA uptake (superfamily II DNA/RNA helicase)
MTYALGRGVEYQDMPLVRSIAHDAGKNGNKFSTLVLDIVKSKPFLMNMKMQETSVSTNKEKGN